MNGEAVVGYLARWDKWYLGGGKAALFAPEFPLFLDQPGFWDHAVYLDYRVGPLFTLALLDAAGREIEPRFIDRVWQPDHATQRYTAPGLAITERRAMSATDVLSATYSFQNTSDTDRDLTLVVWTAQDENGDLTTKRGDTTALLFERAVVDREWRRQQIAADAAKANDPTVGLKMRLGLGIGAATPATSYGLVRSQRQPNYPRWRYSPFYELFVQGGGRLPNAQIADADPLDPGASWLIYGALHYRLHIPANGTADFSVFAAIAGGGAEAVANLKESVAGGATRPDTASVWPTYFDGLPRFACSDPYLQKYYWYRYFGLRLNTITADSPAIGLAHPCIFEGVNLGWFRQHITYSAFCHMREMRWAHDPAVAQGSLLNFIDAQLPNGAFPGVIKNVINADRSLTDNVAFYHADWGRSVQALHALHPDPAFLTRIYGALGRYAHYFERERDAEGSGLFDILNQMETGQEFTSRYLFVDPAADRTVPIRLKGVDVTVYIYNLYRALAWMARQVGEEDAAWDTAAEKTKAAILAHMWDADTQFFYDVAPQTLARSPHKAAVGFYPFLTDIAGPEHLGALTRHLFNPAEFWTPYPAPSLSADDPYYSAEGEWKGTRLVCPWNGRTWLMTNSHLIDALCRTAQTFAPELAPQAVDFLRRGVTMLFTDGDVERPTSYEYYNPVTGQAPYFRGTDDYMHSWISDLIIGYVAGVQPQPDGALRIAPLPFGLTHFDLDRVVWRGHRLRVTWRADATVGAADALVGLTVTLDGVQRAHSPVLAALDITP